MEISIYSLASCLHQEDEIKKQGIKFLNEIEKLTTHHFKLINEEEIKDYAFTLIFVQTGGVEGEFLNHIQYFTQPYILLTYGHNNSLAASMEILSYIKDKNYDGEILHGDYSYIANKINEYAMIFNALQNIRGQKLGVIGKPSDWLIASQIDENTCKALYGIEFIHLSIDELCNEYKKIDFLPSNNFIYENKSELNNATKMSQSIIKICDKYQLKGLTIRCFDLLSKVKTTGCLGLSALNDLRYVGTCEGDIPIMLSMIIVKNLLNVPSFQANPSQIDLKNKNMIFAHCTLPLSMCDSYELDTHFESKIGVATHGVMKTGIVTIFKLSNDLKNYYVQTAKLVENLYENNLCRTQIKLHFTDDMSYFLKRPYGNHHIIIYGDHTSIINQFMLQIKNKKEII